MKKNMSISIILILTLSLITSVSSAWWFSKKNQKEIVVIDVENIIEKRRQEFMSKYTDLDITTASNQVRMQEDIAQFADKPQPAFEMIKNNRTEAVRRKFDQQCSTRKEELLDCWFQPAVKEMLIAAAEKF